MQTLIDLIKSLPAKTYANPRSRIKWIAKELEMGVTKEFWDIKIRTHDNDIDAESVIPRHENLKLYFMATWNIEYIRLEWKLLESYGYLTRNCYFDELTKSALALIDETEPYNMFHLLQTQ